MELKPKRIKDDPIDIILISVRKIIMNDFRVKNMHVLEFSKS